MTPQNLTELKPGVFKSLRALVVGAGSVGKRHASNLFALGVGSVSIVDPREDRRVEAMSLVRGVTAFATENEAYAVRRYDVVIVANPPVFHTESGMTAVRNGAHVLMEKSISHETKGIEAFLKAADAAKRVVGVCYMYRFYEAVRRVKDLLDKSVIGKALSAQITFSEYLPDWHPWEKPSEWYAGTKALGGSELLDENHTVDLARWFFGEVREVWGHVGRLSNVTLDADDFATFTCFHESGTVVQIHQDALGRKPRKDMWITGEKGTIFWDSYLGENSVSCYHGDTKEVERFMGATTRNDAFVAHMRDFLEAVVSGGKPEITGWDAFETLKICECVFESSRQGRKISVL